MQNPPDGTAPASQPVPPAPPAGPGDAFRALLPLLFVLTFITGLVDAISYLVLGHVFVANMTGNVIVLGFSLAGIADFSVPASLTALAMFAAGAALGGRLGVKGAARRRRLLARGLGAEAACVALGAVPLLCGLPAQGDFVRYWLIILLGLAMGLQTATVRLLAVPDLNTTVLTMTLASLAADSSLAGGNNPRLKRRLGAVLLIILGAATGAAMVKHASPALVLALILALLAAGGRAAYRGLAAG